VFQPVEVQFFAASTLQMKLQKNWMEVPQDQWNALKDKLLSAIFGALFGPKNVLNRLCIAVSTIFISYATVICGQIESDLPFMTSPLNRNLNHHKL